MRGWHDGTMTEKATMTEHSTPYLSKATRMRERLMSLSSEPAAR
jgi:hypothetical protein